MKYVKILGLLAVAAAALMAFAGTASATTITSPTGTVATPTIHAVNEGGHVKLANSIANIECASTVEGKVENHGSGVTASGLITKLEFTGCTNSWHVTSDSTGENKEGVKTYGTLEVHWENTGSPAYNGILTSSNSLVTTTRFLVPCNYETNETEIGTVTGGNPATLTISASIPIAKGSSELCGSGNAKWSGSYVTTSALYIDQ